jgi:hypothetical protein
MDRKSGCDEVSQTGGIIMSDQPHSNTDMDRWTSGRGVLLAFVVVLAILVVLASVGSFNTAQNDAVGENAIIPAGEAPILPTE